MRYGKQTGKFSVGDVPAVVPGVAARQLQDALTSSGLETTYLLPILFNMFIHLSEKERHAALSICILCAPVEDTPEIEQHELEQTSWRNDFLSTFGTEVGMDSDDINLQLTRCPSRFDESGEIRRERERSFKHYCEVLRSVGFSDKELVACILAIIVELKRYDGRGSTLLRNIVYGLKLPLMEAVWLISEFCKFVQVQHGRLVHAEDLKEDPFRYAKIGAVAVGAGALLVVTAGLVSCRPRTMSKADLLNE